MRLLLLLNCLLVCCFDGGAPSVLFLLVAVVGNGPLMLVTTVGVCLFKPQGFCPLGCFPFFWWLWLVVVFWRSGASAHPGVFFFPWVVSLEFILWRLSFGFFWRSGASAFSSSSLLRLARILRPPACAYGWCCVLHFGVCPPWGLVAVASFCLWALWGFRRPWRVFFFSLSFFLSFGSCGLCLWFSARASARAGAWCLSVLFVLLFLSS